LNNSSDRVLRLADHLDIEYISSREPNLKHFLSQYVDLSYLESPPHGIEHVINAANREIPYTFDSSHRSWVCPLVQAATMYIHAGKLVMRICAGENFFFPIPHSHVPKIRKYGMIRTPRIDASKSEVIPFIRYLLNVLGTDPREDPAGLLQRIGVFSAANAGRTYTQQSKVHPLMAKQRIILAKMLQHEGKELIDIPVGTYFSSSPDLFSLIFNSKINSRMLKTVNDIYHYLISARVSMAVRKTFGLKLPQANVNFGEPFNVTQELVKWGMEGGVLSKEKAEAATEPIRQEMENRLIECGYIFQEDLEAAIMDYAWRRDNPYSEEIGIPGGSKGNFLISEMLDVVNQWLENIPKHNIYLDGEISKGELLSMFGQGWRDKSIFGAHLLPHRAVTISSGGKMRFSRTGKVEKLRAASARQIIGHFNN